jgi:hypothetical protein
MASIDKEFAPAERAELMKRWSASILAAVVSEMEDRHPSEWSIDEYFRSPRQMIDATLDFDDRHAAMQIRAKRLQWPISGVNPHGDDAAEQLSEAVDALLSQIADCVSAVMPDARDAVHEQSARMKTNLSRLVRKQCGERAILFELGADEAGRGEATVVSVSPPPRSEKKRSTQKIDLDHHLGRLETRMRKKFAADFGSSETAIMEAMIRELYSLSADDLAPLLKRLGFKVCARTIRRRGNSEKYAAWERYRKPHSAAGTAVDPTRPNSRNQVRSEATAKVEDAVDSGNLNLRVGGRGIMQTRKNAAERAADRDAEQFARDAGVELPPAE